MKKGFFSYVAIAALMVFMSAGSLFAAENTGFYVTLNGGFVVPQNTMTISDPDDSDFHFETMLKNGGMVGVTAGWLTPFTQRIMAMELEYNYIFGTDLDNRYVTNFGEGPGTMDNINRIHAILFNLKARYPSGAFHPYAGVGVGWSIFQVGDITAREFGGPGIMQIKGATGNGFCWQLMAGIDYDITPHLGVNLGWKYLASKPTIGSSSDEGIYSDFDFKANIFSAGLTYTF